jgi:hypothetical protein
MIPAQYNDTLLPLPQHDFRTNMFANDEAGWVRSARHLIIAPSSCQISVNASRMKQAWASVKCKA